MLHINSNEVFTYNYVSKKEKILSFLNEKKFRVADTPLSYRQANSLDESGVLVDERKDEKKWRQFSFKEIIYFTILAELRKYGVRNDKMVVLRDSFFNEKEVELGEMALNPIEGNNEGDIILTLVLCGVQMILVLDSEPSVDYYDAVQFSMRGIDRDSFAFVNVNNIVNRVLKTGGEQQQIKYQPLISIITSTMQDMNYGKERISEKESELLRIVRDKEYSVIRIKKVDGEITTIYGEKNNQSEMTTTEFEKLLRERDFRNISVTQTDGKVVNYKVEDVYKV